MTEFDVDDLTFPDDEDFDIDMDVGEVLGDDLNGFEDQDYLTDDYAAGPPDNEEGYYDEDGFFIQGYYDEDDYWVEGYYTETNDWVTISRILYDENGGVLQVDPAYSKKNAKGKKPRVIFLSFLYLASVYSVKCI